MIVFTEIKTSLYQIYRVADSWKHTQTLDMLTKLHDLWITQDCQFWSNWMIIVLKQQKLWDDTKTEKNTIVETVLSNNLKVYPFYFFRILDQTNCDRPKRFEKQCWDNAIKPFKKQIYDRYSVQITNIENNMKLVIENKLKCL